MIKRIVKLTFAPDKAADFLVIFDEMKHQIRSFEGCRHLELWRSRAEANVFFTMSIWDSEAHLNIYRQSEVFAHTWLRTKTLFANRAEAWSVDVIAE